MKRVVHDKAQTVQRVRVGVIGLAVVILLIGLASLLLSGVRRDRGSDAAGGGNASVVANMAALESIGNESDEPLADLGVAPGSASVDNAADAQAR
ncbi:MAG TPA: hypothetical protein VF636_00820 [Sphingomonas sp.]|jgi:hypothetical protein